MIRSSLSVDPHTRVAKLDRRLFGTFVEHLGRSVYDGIYEPEHSAANEDGFRLDVIELVKELGASTIRYPGGNFVSGYRWEDGVGPKDERPVRRDLAWHSIETNQVGLDEFARWCRLVDAELMLAINLGTRGIDAALDLLDYANHPSGTALSDQRIANGSPQPHDVRMWCLGNEMDGPWQIGHMSADEYGRLAARTASALRRADDTLELVVCGSSSSRMPTFGEWERVVLEHSYEFVDYISCHAYYQERDGDLQSFLASSADLQHFIDTIGATIDYVRSTTGSSRTVSISFDEWNIWYLDEHRASDEVNDEWRVAPRQLEDVYSVADAVVMGSLLITLLRNHDRVRAASLAQAVNVIAPIMTEPGGPAWRQTTFFPFSTTARLASGDVLKPRIDSPLVTSQEHGAVTAVDAVATLDDGALALFIVNRSANEPAEVSIDLGELQLDDVAEAVMLSDPDPYRKNTLAEQEAVQLQPLSIARDGGILRVALPPVAWGAVSMRLRR